MKMFILLLLFLSWVSLKMLLCIKNLICVGGIKFDCLWIRGWEVWIRGWEDRMETKVENIVFFMEIKIERNIRKKLKWKEK